MPKLLIPQPRGLPPIDQMSSEQLVSEARRLAVNFADAEYLSPLLKRLADEYENALTATDRIGG